MRLARVSGPIPGPRSRAILERERQHLAPGIQNVSQLAGIAVTGGEGALLHDADGNVFLDFFAGMGVASLGHGHPALARALAEQAARVSATSFASEARASLVERIARACAPIDPRLCVTQLYSGGSEAVESALRLARAATGRTAVIAFEGGFHGKTAGAAGLMGLAQREAYGPFPPGLHTVPFGDLGALERAVAEHAPAAILVEPIQGTAGNLIPPRGFLAGVEALAHRAGALLLADEMITGWGRTGRLFAVEHERVRPDVLLFGKGVAAGYPVSGLVTRAELAAAEPWSRPSYSSSSYGGSPLAAAAADAVTRVIVEERLAEHAARVGEQLFAALGRLAERHACVTAVRGRGLLLGLDLALTPEAPETHERLFHECVRRGLLALTYTRRVRINPPLVITEAQALEGVALLDEALTAVETARVTA